MMDKSLGKRIRALRELRKLSQEKVAEKCGVETSSVSRWETGRLYHIFSFFKEFCLNSRNLCIKL